MKAAKLLKRMAGTTGLEPATSDVTGRTSQGFLVRIPLFLMDLLRASESSFRAATVRASVLLLGDFDFAIDQLHCLLAKLREEMLVAFQRLALVAGMLGDDIIRNAFSQEDRC